jgi:hypothetical protein
MGSSNISQAATGRCAGERYGWTETPTGQGGVDSDDPAGARDQRSAGVLGVQRGVGLEPDQRSTRRRRPNAAQ